MLSMTEVLSSLKKSELKDGISEEEFEKNIDQIKGCLIYKNWAIFQIRDYSLEAIVDLDTGDVDYFDEAILLVPHEDDWRDKAKPYYFTEDEMRAA